MHVVRAHEFSAMVFQLTRLSLAAIFPSLDFFRERTRSEYPYAPDCEHAPLRYNTRSEEESPRNGGLGFQILSSLALLESLSPSPRVSAVSC